MRCQDVASLVGATPDGLPSGQELAACALREPIDPHVTEHLVGSVQMLTRVHAASLTPHPLAVHEMRAGELPREDAADQLRDERLRRRLGVEASRGHDL